MQPTPWKVKITHDEPVRHFTDMGLGSTAETLIYVVKVCTVDATGRVVEGMGFWMNHSPERPLEDRHVEEYLDVQAMRFAVDTINALAASTEEKP